MGNNSRKFYYGDKVVFSPPQEGRYYAPRLKYYSHRGHTGFITETYIHINSQTRYATYRVECLCGTTLRPRAMDIQLVQERGMEEDQESKIDKRRKHFLSTLLGVDIAEGPTLAAQVKHAMRMLSDRERSIMTARHGLTPDHEHRQTLEVVASNLTPPITRERVRQIQRRAFERMRDRI